jgi:tetratricopeptide (TPR) repeat protein
VRVLDGNSSEIKTRKDFEIPKNSVLAVSDSIAREVADYLRKQVGDQVRIRQERSRTSNVAAWTALQRAEKVRKDAIAQAASGDSSSSKVNFARADSLLMQAESLDKDWVDPVAQRSVVALARARVTSDPLEAKPWIDRGLADANRALASDPRNVDALEARGNLRYLAWILSLASTQREAAALLDSAEADLSKAVSITPSKADAWFILSNVYAQKDDPIKAKTAAQRAYEEDTYLSGADKVLWRLYATSYNLEQFPDAVKYCAEGGRRFPDSPLFVQCRLWLFTTRAVVPSADTAWAYYGKLAKLTPSRQWDFEQHQFQMLVAAAIARSGNQDSARKVLRRARPDSKTDPQGGLSGLEAFIWTLVGTPKDTTEAIDLLRRYLTANPQHRAGYANATLWWWTGLKTDRRFQDLVGTGTR